MVTILSRYTRCKEIGLLMMTALDRMHRYDHLIKNAMAAHDRAKSEWAKKYWLGVAKQLAENFKRKEPSMVH